MFRASNNRGFTIVELVVVIIILGIISAVAAPRFFDLQDYKEIAFKDELVSALRFAQKRAVASGEVVEVVIQSNGYSVHYAASGNTVKHPAGSSPDQDIEDGSFTNLKSPTDLDPITIFFDALGRPCDQLAGEYIPWTNSNTVNDGRSISIKIWHETGCVEPQ
jgi:MSHA pilin protein MshC